jgi:hypothetical protein
LRALPNRSLRLLDPAAAAAQVAQAVLIVLTGFGQVLQAADDVAAAEILLGVTIIFTRRAEVLSGFAKVAVVAVVVVMAMAAVATLSTLTAEETTQSAAQHLSDEGHGKTRETKHCHSPFF